MGKRKTAAAVLALAFSLFSVTAVYAAEGKRETPLHYATIEKIPENAEALKGKYIPVLMYHQFSEERGKNGDNMVAWTVELEDHLKYLQKAGYQVITLEELDAILLRKEYDYSLHGIGLDLEQQYLCITMDDGYYSNYELAYPLFRKYATPASVFAVTDFVTEQYGVQKFTWEQAQEMDETGWLRTYSHSADHIPVQAGQEEAFLACMQKSEAVLQENLEKERVKAMAYPNGQYTKASQELLTEDGYQLQFTIDEGVITRATKRSALPRITVESGMTGEDLVRKIEMAAERAFAAEREGNKA